MPEFTIHNASISLPSGDVLEGDLRIKDGQITELGPRIEARGESFDAQGLWLLPGIIDSQVHFREPGLEHKEDLETGTASAALGGITSLFEMPNTSPNTDTPEALADKLKRGQGRTHCDHAFFLGATKDNAARLGEWEGLPGCAGVKIFMGSSTGNLLVDDDEALAEVLKSGRRRVAVHCEDEPRLIERKKIAEASQDVADHPNWRDAQSAILATQRLLRLARTAKRQVHVLHVTTGEEMQILREHKGLATVEVTPQHLTLAAETAYPELGSLAQMNPPIRGEAERQALWKALQTGIVDVIGSDHAPHTREEKARPYPKSPSGLPGVQTMLPLMLDHMHHGALSRARLVELFCSGPQRIYGIARKGRIAPGYDADFCFVDPKAEVQWEDSMIASRCGYTPFAGRNTHGKVVHTMLRGQWTVREGQLTDNKIGQPVVFEGYEAKKNASK